MSGNNTNDQSSSTNAYYYQYGATSSYPPASQNWNWTTQQQQQYHRNVPPPSISAAYNTGQYYQGYSDQQSQQQQQYTSQQATRQQQFNFANLPPPPPPPLPGPSDSRTQSYNSGSRSRMSDYNSMSTNGNSYSNANGSQYPDRRFKRNSVDDGDRRRKKKKPLSQKNLPTKSKWTREEAQRALDCEKEFNKLSKNSLIIKFPDFPISRDMVTKYHSDINSIYFPTPVGPRNCFISLKPESDPTEVIKLLETIVPEGASGPLKVEVKPNRTENKEAKPEDIDPLTLYVGNLAPDVQKEDIVTMFPRNRRIDIGFAKKMKYTRYAFVVFHNCVEALEAFKSSFHVDLYGKSLIVRFRRVHGTVGMPGEANLLNPANRIERNPLNNSDESLNESCSNISEQQNITLNTSTEDISSMEAKEVNLLNPANRIEKTNSVESLNESSHFSEQQNVTHNMSTEDVSSMERKEDQGADHNIEKTDESPTGSNGNLPNSEEIPNTTDIDLNIVKQEPITSSGYTEDVDINKLFAMAARPIIVKTEANPEEVTEPPLFDEEGKLAVKIKEEPLNDDSSDEEEVNRGELDALFEMVQVHNQKTQSLRNSLSNNK